MTTLHLGYFDGIFYYALSEDSTLDFKTVSRIQGGTLVATFKPVSVTDLGGVRGVHMHPPLVASNVFSHKTARIHQMIIQQWNAATTTRHSYTLTYQFLTDLQMID